MKYLSRFPEALPFEEEQKLATPNPLDRAELVSHNMREAMVYCRHFARQQFGEEAIMSIAFQALEKAARTFKPGQVRFMAYSKVFIRGAVCKACRDLKVVRNLSEPPEPMPEHTDDLDSDDSRLIPFGVEDPEYDAIHTHEMWEKVKPLLESLTEKEREVIRLKYEKGLNYPEIGRLCGGVSRSAIQGTHARAIGKLRAALQGKL